MTYADSKREPELFVVRVFTPHNILSSVSFSSSPIPTKRTRAAAQGTGRPAWTAPESPREPHLG